MISWAELRLGCRGLLLLARFDAQFLRYFDRSAAGALRSFQLALLILPFYLFQFWLEVDDAAAAGAGRYLAARTLGYAYGWILFPMVILLAGRLLDRDAQAPGCLAIYNWLSLLWVALQVPVLLLIIIDPDSGLAVTLSLVTLFYSVLVEGFMLMHGLRILLWQAAGLCAIDVALSFFLIAPLSTSLGGAAVP